MIQWFSVCSALWDDHSSLISEHYNYNPWNKPLCPLAFTPHSPRQPLVYSVYGFAYWAFHVNGIVQYVAFCVLLVSLSMCSEFTHVVCVSTPFSCGLEVLHCVAVVHFVSPFIRWTPGWFSFFAYYDEWCHAHLYISVCGTYVVDSLGHIPRSGIAGHMVTLFNFLKHCQTVSKAVAPCAFPPVQWQFCSPPSHQGLSVLFLIVAVVVGSGISLWLWFAFL